MTTAFVTHKRFINHTMSGHPEHAGRLQAVWNKIDEGGLRERMMELTPKPLLEEVILLAHTRNHLSRLGDIEAMSDSRLMMIDGDTYMTQESYTLARMAAGAVCMAVDAVLDGEADNALAAVRPPGHHATPNRAMGFCLLNNIAIAALHAVHEHELERVMIVDYDVHHGNGTQDILYNDDSVMFLSTHQYPLYPGTGMVHETGKGSGDGYTVNVPMPPRCGDVSYKRVFDEIVWKVTEKFKPELILVSAGFDAHWSDPLAGMRLSLTGYADLSRELIRMADQFCDGKIVFVMEGGYDLEAVGNGMANIARLLLGDEPIDPMGLARAGSEPDISELIRLVQGLHDLH